MSYTTRRIEHISRGKNVQCPSTTNMKFLPLLWRIAMRRRVRTVLTALSIATAFLLFGLLAAVRAALSFGVEIAGADTLMMFQKVSLARPLPLGYYPLIASTPGVAAVTHATWFGGVYQDSKNWFPQLAVDARSFLEMHPDYRVAPDAQRAWLADRSGCIVGEDVAKRFGWRVGDRIPLRNASWPAPDGAPWSFTIHAIYEAGRPGADLSQMFFHYEYLNETRTRMRDTVGWYIIRVTHPEVAGDVAARLDSRFANSSEETKTATTKAFLQAWASQIGDVGAIIIAVVSMVFFTILLVTGTTMAQAVRERTSDLGVLKALGFSDGLLLSLVLLESVGVSVCGGAFGLGLAWVVVQHGDPTGGLMPAFYLPTIDLAIGAAFVLLLGLATGVLPARQAGRLRIVEALRR
jgi:putative ABC transport system permease protein